MRYCQDGMAYPQSLALTSSSLQSSLVHLMMRDNSLSIKSQPNLVIQPFPHLFNPFGHLVTLSQPRPCANNAVPEPFHHSLSRGSSKHTSLPHAPPPPLTDCPQRLSSLLRAKHQGPCKGLDTACPQTPRIPAAFLLPPQQPPIHSLAPSK